MLLLLCLLVFGSAPAIVCAQAKVAPRKLPSAEEIVNGYLKAIGGKKRVRSIRDATYEWTVWANNKQAGSATTRVLVPSSARVDLALEDGRLLFVVNDRSAWTLGRDGKFQTLSDAELNAAGLQAVLDANHLLDFKKRNVMARVISYQDTESFGPAYVVEFYLRTGARRKYWFHSVSKLLMRIDDEDPRTITKMENYRTGKLILEPHRVVINNGGVSDLIFILKSATYNTGIPKWLFERPRPVGSKSQTGNEDR
ncbi:MAG TPA: hypothetical protein VJU84_12455 [Pyrinomonadaceae bacterium]|nr:hypothetical protein [Pyrinomonadaceae bacterium]